MIDYGDEQKEGISLVCRGFFEVDSAEFAATALIGLRANTQEHPTDHGDAVPVWYSFDLVKDRVEEGGWTHEVTERELLSAKSAVGVKVQLEAGSYNKFHCHTTDQWAYLHRGDARITIMDENGTVFIGDVSEGDISILPAGYSRCIQGLSPDGTEILLIFPQGAFSKDGGSFFRSGWPTH